MASPAQQEQQAQAFIEAQIEQAKRLLDAKDQVLVALRDVRGILHSPSLLTTASEEQRAWVQENLPRRTRNKDGNGEPESGDEE